MFCTAMERLEITVTGRVQGVGFRWHTVRQATALELGGRVRNQPDGSVHIVAEGPRPALEALLAWAREGPSHARVDGCQPWWQQATGEFAGFDVAS